MPLRSKESSRQGNSAAVRALSLAVGIVAVPLLVYVFVYQADQERYYEERYAAELGALGRSISEEAISKMKSVARTTFRPASDPPVSYVRSRSRCASLSWRTVTTAANG
jgi:hypothetical protein